MQKLQEGIKQLPAEAIRTCSTSYNLRRGKVHQKHLQFMRIQQGLGRSQRQQKHFFVNLKPRYDSENLSSLNLPKCTKRHTLPKQSPRHPLTIRDVGQRVPYQRHPKFTTKNQTGFLWIWVLISNIVFPYSYAPQVWILHPRVIEMHLCNQCPAFGRIYGPNHCKITKFKISKARPWNRGALCSHRQKWMQ